MSNDDLSTTGECVPQTDPARSVAIGPQTWQEILPMLLALLTSGTSAGQVIAQRELARMAAAADLGASALAELGKLAAKT